MAKKKSQYVKKPHLENALNKDLSENVKVFVATAAWHMLLTETFELLKEPGGLQNNKFIRKLDTITAIANYFGVRGIAIDDVLTKRINKGKLSWDVFGLINLLTNEPKFGLMTFGEAVTIIEGALFVWAEKVNNNSFELLRDNYGINTEQKTEGYTLAVQIADFSAFCKTMKINPQEIEFSGYPYLLNPDNIKKRMERLGDK